MGRFAVLSMVAVVAFVARRRLVALLTKSTGTWVGTPPRTSSADPGDSAEHGR
jgi:hypothetical protein